MWKVPYLEVGKLYFDDFLHMLGELAAEDARQQRPVAQLSRITLGKEGLELENFYTGYAANYKKTNVMPAHLHRALEIGLKLEKVSDAAFVTMRSLRE